MQALSTVTHPTTPVGWKQRRMGVHTRHTQMLVFSLASWLIRWLCRAENRECTPQDPNAIPIIHHSAPFLAGWQVHEKSISSRSPYSNALMCYNSSIAPVATLPSVVYSGCTHLCIRRRQELRRANPSWRQTLKTVKLGALLTPLGGSHLYPCRRPY